VYPTVIIPSMNPILCEKARAFIPADWPVITKDGNPLTHFDDLRKLNISTRWAINLDEDCFLMDPDGVLRLIQLMEEKDYQTAGIQDGSSYARQHNPVIFNPFFFIFNVAAVQAAPKRDGDIVSTSEAYRHLVRFTDAPYAFDNFEPYYRFFLDLLQAGCKPLFLANHAYEAFDERGYNLCKPSIVRGEDGGELAIHAWYSRLYHEPVVQDRIAVCENYANAHLVRNQG